jgi:phage terminase large subunit-like protein
MAAPKKPTCILTPKQIEANELLGSDAKNICLVGGARSGKTFVAVRALAVRAIKAARSRHLIARLHKNHVVASIGRDTFPRVMELCFPGVPYKLDHSEWFATLPNKSEIWLGGLDDRERVDKILGTEFSTIFLNECSQIPLASVDTVRTRLAQKAGLRNRMIYDLNPSGTGHWCHRLFVEKVIPHTRAPLANPEDFVSLLMNPVDNLANLPPDYVSNLDTLPEKQRLRFKEGQWLSELDNALWKYEMFRRVPVNPFDCQRIVVAVDPSGASGREDVRSDEIGIVVAAKLKPQQRYAVLADRSMRGSPQQWAAATVTAYNEFGADLVVAEKNFGGSLVEANLRHADRNIPIKLVTASRGKAVRAEPIAHLYARGEVDHADTFAELEQQATEMTTAGYMGQRSPDRLDALVWALTELSGVGKQIEIIGLF